MQGTLRTRSAGAALGFGALAGCFALSAPALAIAPTDITHSEITSPTGPFHSVFDSSAASNPQFTFSGTSDGDSSDTVDIRCYTIGTSYNTLVSNVPVNDDGTFTSDPTELGGVYDDACHFRAVQSGNDPTDVSPFTGPWAGVSESDSYLISGGPNDGTKYDFFADLWQRSGHVEYDSVSNCGISEMEIMSPLSRQSSGSSWDCSAVLSSSDPQANAPGRSEIEVDGTQAYGAYAANNLFSGGPNSADNTGFQALTSSVSQNAATGDGLITEEQSFVACPGGPGNYPANAGNCSPDFADTGVKLSRTYAQSDDGRSVLVTDSWSSTDGSAHQLKLHYDNGLSGCCDSPQWGMQGNEPGAVAPGEVADGFPSGPGSVTGRVSTTAVPSVQYPAFSMTWDTAPDQARFFQAACCPSGALRFLSDYTLTVPETGAKVMRFAYTNSPTQAGADAEATRSRDAFGAPTVTITTPANGSTVNTATVNVGGSALDNVGVASLVVNGTPVTPAADGTYSVPVALAAGANALTATVKDAAGNTATATGSVTYTPTPATTPAVKCVVPSVKRGSKVSTAKKLMAKAHCKSGRLVKKRSAKTKKGRVISLVNSPGITFPAGQKLQIIVSSGKKHKAHKTHKTHKKH
jgi:hypothetical protein